MTEVLVPKTRDPFSRAGATEHGLVIGETARDLVTWIGDRPPLVVAYAGGTSFAEATRRIVVERGAIRSTPWPISAGHDVVVHFDPWLDGSLRAWAEVLARASLLILQEPLGPRVRHVLKLAGVAGIPRTAFVVDAAVDGAREGDAGDGDGVEAERALRTRITTNGGDGDSALVLRADPAFRVDDTARIAAGTGALVDGAPARAFPDGPLVNVIPLATAPNAGTAPAKAALFTGRCVVAASVTRPAAGTAPSIGLSAHCLAPPAGLVAWLDEENDLVAVRKVRK